jgi:hypothetical protein
MFLLVLGLYCGADHQHENAILRSLLVRSSTQELQSSASAIEHKDPAIERICTRAQDPRSSALHVHPCFLHYPSSSLSLLRRGNSEQLRVLESTMCDPAHPLTWQHIIFVINRTSLIFLKATFLEAALRAEILCFLLLKPLIHHLNIECIVLIYLCLSLV